MKVKESVKSKRLSETTPKFPRYLTACKDKKRYVVNDIASGLKCIDVQHQLDNPLNQIFIEEALLRSIKTGNFEDKVRSVLGIIGMILDPNSETKLRNRISRVMNTLEVSGLTKDFLVSFINSEMSEEDPVQMKTWIAIKGFLHTLPHFDDQSYIKYPRC